MEVKETVEVSVDIFELEEFLRNDEETDDEADEVEEFSET